MFHSHSGANNDNDSGFLDLINDKTPNGTSVAHLM